MSSLAITSKPAGRPPALSLANLLALLRARRLAMSRSQWVRPLAHSEPVRVTDRRRVLEAVGGVLWGFGREGRWHQLACQCARPTAETCDEQRRARRAGAAATRARTSFAIGWRAFRQLARAAPVHSTASHFAPPPPCPPPIHVARAALSGRGEGRSVGRSGKRARLAEAGACARALEKRTRLCLAGANFPTGLASWLPASRGRRRCCCWRPPVCAHSGTPPGERARG